MKKSIVLSCIQPTGEMHIGNYFGAIKNWVDLQKDNKCIYGIVDLHATTDPYDPKELWDNTSNMIKDLISCGIDPKKSILFIQSLVPEHTELAWILGCVTPYGELKKQTQFKEKSRNKKADFISAGVLNYPILQAADILIYKANYVPVGKDQKQHLELTRNIAQRFNNHFGQNFFPIPEHKFTQTPKIMSLIEPSKKMSKSLGSKHYVGLFEEENSIRKKINKAVTDTGKPKDNKISEGVYNLFELLKACGKSEISKEFKNQYFAGTIRYGELKNEVANSVIEITNDLKERRKNLDDVWVNEIIREMSMKAREIAINTINEVRSITGIRNINHF